MDNTSYLNSQTASKPNDSKPATQNMMIPKHRFDCINVCLKETKLALRDKVKEADNAKNRVAELERALLGIITEKELAIQKARNLTAVKALIDFSDLKLEQDGYVPGLREQILCIKENQSYLFEDEESTTYVLVPVKSGDDLSKSITEYIKRTDKTK